MSQSASRPWYQRLVNSDVVFIYQDKWDESSVNLRRISILVSDLLKKTSRGK